MGILDIDNRTENWKTAYTFTPFLKDNVRLTNLAKQLLGDADDPLDEIHIEFFWKGVRDWVHPKGEDRAGYVKDFVGRYNRLFRNLRVDIEKSRLFRPLNDRNYRVPPQEEETLYQNLINTEIDIVIESANHLFIGEAKHEMTFGTNGELVLVHQLIRQYVTARVLVDRINSDGYPKKEVVPFVVGDDAANLLKNHQIQFMVCQEWLREDNVLSWSDIDNI